MTTDLNTLLTALYVWIDDYLGPRRRPGRPPRLTDAELLTLAVAQALLGIHSETRWLRLIPQRLPGAFPYLPGQSGDNKRLRAAWPLVHPQLDERQVLMSVLDHDTHLVGARPGWC